MQSKPVYFLSAYISTAIKGRSVAAWQIRNDFGKLNIRPGIDTQRLLSRYPSAKYQELIDRLTRFKAQENVLGFGRILVPSAKEILDLDLKELSDPFLNEQINLDTLDLTGLPIKYSSFLQKYAIAEKMDKPHSARKRTGASRVGPKEEEPKTYDPEKLFMELSEYYSVVTKKIRDKMSGEKLSVQVIDIRVPHLTIPDPAQDSLTQCFADISRKGWEQNVGRKNIPGYSAEFVAKHFVAVDRAFLVYNPQNQDMIAFSVITRLKDKENGYTLHQLGGGMVKPRYHNMRLASNLTGQLIMDDFVEGKMNNMLVTGRTPNPQVLGLMLALADPYPNPFLEDARPNDAQRKIIEFTAKYVNPSETIDPETGVISDVYSLETGMVVPPWRIPEYRRHPEAEILLRSLLEYDKHNNPIFFNDELKQADLNPIINALNIDPGKTAARSSEDIFNDLLKRSGFYELILPKLGSVSLPSYAHQLEAETREIRRLGFETLNRDDQFIITYFNRMLMETLFPALPKRAARAVVVQGVASTNAVDQFKRKQCIIDYQQWGISIMRRLINKG